MSSTSGWQFAGGCGTTLTLEDFRGAVFGILGAGGTTITWMEVTQ